MKKKQLNYKRRIHGVRNTADVLLDIPELAPSTGFYGIEPRPPKSKQEQRKTEKERKLARKKYFMAGLTT